MPIPLHVLRFTFHALRFALGDLPQRLDLQHKQYAQTCQGFFPEQSVFFLPSFPKRAIFSHLLCHRDFDGLETIASALIPLIERATELSA